MWAGMSQFLAGTSVSARSVFVEAAATLLGVSRRTVYYRIRQGKLLTIRTRCGSQRVLLESIHALTREQAAKLAARRDAKSKAEPLTLEIQSLS
jgi:excisionase family DNA binding protein